MGHTGAVPEDAEADPPGPLIGSGRAADVYDLGDGRVLRRNRSGGSTAREAAVMGHVRAHGYPVPRVHDADGPDLVMDRVEGPTMLEAFGRKPWRLWGWADLLADLHRQLGAVPVPDLDLPRREGPAEVLVPVDQHPDNVLLTA
ncbi:MAG: phosphotransferase, partial [Actinomycetota bacterium]